MRGALRDNRRRIDLQIINFGKDMIEHTDMLYHRAFRLAGGTRSKDDVSKIIWSNWYVEIGRSLAVPHSFKFVEKHNRRCSIQLLFQRTTKIALLRNHDLRASAFDDGLYSLFGIIRIDGN